MPKLSSESKKLIASLPKKELEQVVTKWAGRDKLFYEFLLVNFLDPDYGEQDLFAQYKIELDKLAVKSFTGRIESIRQAKLLKASAKTIATFRKTVKATHLEVELWLHVLDGQFEVAAQCLGGYYQVYDNVLARTVKKVIGLIQEKLHEDYFLEYQGRINGYLLTLHRLAPFNTVVRALPGRV